MTSASYPTATPSMTRVDIAVVGAGIAGLALASGLAKAGWRVALVGPAVKRPAQAWDARIFAISPGSMRLLQRLGADTLLDHSRIGPVLRMRVFAQQEHAVAGPGAATGATSSLHDEPGDPDLSFAAFDHGADRLASIIEQRNLEQALQQAAAAQGVRLVQSTGSALRLAPDQAELLTASGDRIIANLVVGADGANSWLRAQAGILFGLRDYGQLGVVANFTASRPHLDSAWQWFREDGILAMLPLPKDQSGRDRLSMVWSTPTLEGQDLLSESADVLCERVAQACGGRFGALELLSPAAGFPLRLMQADAFVGSRVALVGDAAHVVHPLAGQGLNLGLGDVTSLLDRLGQPAPDHDPGDPRVLAAYAAERRQPVAAMKMATEGLYRLFSAQQGWLAGLRKTGMRMVDRHGLLKSALVAQAML